MQKWAVKLARHTKMNEKHLGNVERNADPLSPAQNILNAGVNDLGRIRFSPRFAAILFYFTI